MKGGHLEGDADDLLVLRDGDGASGKLVTEWMRGERIAGDPVHGTGCALSAAITAGLALGHPLRDAVIAARQFVRDAIGHAQPLPNGARILSFP